MTYRVCLGGEKRFPALKKKKKLYLFFFFLNYCSLTTLFRPSRSPFLTSRRRTVWEWHKRSLRVNTRLQRESAINTIQYYSIGRLLHYRLVGPPPPLHVL